MASAAFRRLYSCGRHRLGQFKPAAVSPWQRNAVHVRSASYFPINDDLFGLTEEQKQLRQTVFNFVQKELAPLAAKIDKEDNFPGMRDFWLKCGELGLLGITAPEQYGGSGAKVTEQCLVIEEMARACPAMAISYGAHSNMCVNQLVRNGSEEQKQRFLPDLCSGKKIGALAMSEVSAGSDVVSMKCRAEKSGDHYILNGSKFWISNGPVADTIIVYAKTDMDPKKPQHGVTAFVVEEGMEGFKRGRTLDKLGNRGSPTGELIFEDCKVPEANVLGKENRGVYVLFSGLDIERMITAAGGIGVLQACCDLSFEYANTRKQFGTAIGNFQLIQGKMADMYTALQFCRSYVYNVSRAADNGIILTKDAAASLMIVGTEGLKLALDTVQILGGNGYINDYAAGRLLRDAQVATIVAGTTEIRKLVIGRAINDEYKQ